MQGTGPQSSLGLAEPVRPAGLQTMGLGAGATTPARVLAHEPCRQEVQPQSEIHGQGATYVMKNTFIEPIEPDEELRSMRVRAAQFHSEQPRPKRGLDEANGPPTSNGVGSMSLSSPPVSLQLMSVSTPFMESACTDEMAQPHFSQDCEQPMSVLLTGESLTHDSQPFDVAPEERRPAPGALASAYIVKNTFIEPPEEEDEELASARLFASRFSSDQPRRTVHSEGDSPVAQESVLQSQTRSLHASLRGALLQALPPPKKRSNDLGTILDSLAPISEQTAKLHEEEEELLASDQAWEMDEPAYVIRQDHTEAAEAMPEEARPC